VIFIFSFLVQGTSTKYSPQRVGVHHVMHDEDVIQVVKKWRSCIHNSIVAV